MKKLDFKKLDVLSPNVVENDLLYIASVLAQVDNVISKTYGPKSGYVASLQRHGERGNRAIAGITYTKDGYSTLLKMNFNNAIDSDILDMAILLAKRIKDNSGDGSTTGAKILYNMIRIAAEKILNEDPDRIKDLRVNTPKSVEKIVKELNKVIDNRRNKNINPQDILDCAYIALNNDKSLLKPFEDIVNHMKENNVELDEDLEIGAFKSSGEYTTVDKNPGFNLGTRNFVGREMDHTLDKCKLIMLSNTLSADYYAFIVRSLINDAQTYGEATGESVVFLVSSLDNNVKTAIKKAMKSVEGTDNKIYCDFIELSYAHDATNSKREDLSYFLNIDEININDYVEKRLKPVHPQIDNMDNNELVKWRISMNEEGNAIIDDLSGIRNYQEVYMEQLQKGVTANIKYIHGLGLTVTPLPGEISKNTMYKNHIAKLKSIANNTKEPDLAQEAQERLSYMKEKYYSINVAKRISDDKRLFDAYNDATRAVTSMVKNGYHMGASIGAQEILSETIPLLKDKYCREILNILSEAINTIITELANDIDRNANILDLIDLEKMTFGNHRVIQPIETDRVILETVLYQFANIFGSLMLELDTPEDRFHIIHTVQQIKNNLERSDGDDVKKTETPKEKVEVDNSVIIKESVPALNIDMEYDEYRESIQEDKEEKEVSPIKIELEEIKPVINEPKEESAIIEDKKDVYEESKPDTPELTTEEDPFLRMKAELEKDIAVNKLEASIPEDIKSEFTKNGQSIQQNIDNFIKGMEEFYGAKTVEEVKGEGGVSIKLEYPKAITKDDLEKIKNGEWGEL